MPPNLTTSVFAEAAVCQTSLQKSVPVSYPSEVTARKKYAITQNQTQTQPQTQTQQPKPGQRPEMQLVWRNVLAFVYLHIGALYGLYLAFTVAKASTNLWAFALLVCGAVGVTAGAHRLWAHRAYKARWQLRLLLAVFQTLAFQNHIYEWVRDHRVHHKFTDTDADPHNAARGFFFSHMGWLMVRKHPDVRNKGRLLDLSDLDADPIVVWQKRLYLILMPLVCFVLPTVIPVYLWNENPWTAWYVAAIMRYTVGLNGTWLVNSAAHIWGTKPVDRNISPTENISVAWIAFGEGWHNYHHVFPWDYKAAELGNYKGNLTTGFIDFFAKIGWAYDLKTVKAEMVAKRVRRTGDGTHPKYALKEGEKEETEEDQSHHHYNPYGVDVWGWGDKDMKYESVSAATTILHKVDS